MEKMTKSNFKLEKKVDFKCNAKILIVVLDGVGFIEEKTNINNTLEKKSETLPSQAFFHGNAVNAAFTPNLWKLTQSPLFRTLKAHGVAVGLPSDDDMGNSEVGHNAIGSGRIFAQGAKLVNAAFESGDLFRGKTWLQCVQKKEMSTGHNTLHLCGLFSDGNVHSHIDHLFKLIEGAKKFKVKKVRLHLLLDGRDVSPLSALDYVEKLDKFLMGFNDDTFDCRVASGGGRTFVTMDRYEADWNMVQRGYEAHILGEGRGFSSISSAIETYRAEKNYYDQDLPPFVIYENEKAIGAVEDGDSFIFFNFRGDRAIEISKALTQKEFHPFIRKRFPKIDYAGMMQYDGDLKLPENFLVSPPLIDNTMTELLSAQGVKQFACSETQKYGHVTFFWNGNRSEKFNANLEHYVEIPSDKFDFSERPWMKSAEIIDETILQMKKNSFEIGRINLANGDMVGHTGHFAASVVSLSCVDLALGRLMEAAKATNTILLVTADHGNADEMYELNKKTNAIVLDKNGLPKPKTSHTLSPVPFCLYNTDILNCSLNLKTDLPQGGLANIASTVLELAGFKAPQSYEPSLLNISNERNEKAKINSKSLLASALCQSYLPTLNYAMEISKAAGALGFCWPTLQEVFQDIELEVQELKKELEAPQLDEIKIADEIGDILFSVSNVADFLNQMTSSQKFNLDIIARDAIEKFTNRFLEMEKICSEKSTPLTKESAKQLSVEQWMSLWRDAKKRRYR